MQKVQYVVGILAVICLMVLAWSLLLDLFFPPVHPTSLSGRPVASIFVAAMLVGIGVLVIKWLHSVKRRLNPETKKDNGNESN